jgi:hypothetical protein
MHIPEAALIAIALAAGAALLPAPQSSRRRNHAGDSLRVLYVAAPAVLVIAIAVTAARLAATRGLWLDEFGTFWVIGGTFQDVSARTYAFHGQSPFYYYVPWALIHLFGMSEAVIRAPSLVFVLAASLLIGWAAAAWHGRASGVAAVVFTLSLPPVLEAAVDARPYGLALASYASAWLGFAWAVSGRWEGRLLFVGSAALLFWTHYIQAVFLLGPVAAYAVAPAFRRHYRLHSFATDVTLIIVFCLPGLPHLNDLWSRRGALDWVRYRDHSVTLPLVLPAVVMLLVAVASPARRHLFGDQRVRGALAAVAAPVVFMHVASELGPNLLAPRYLLPGALGATFFAGCVSAMLAARAKRFAGVLIVGLALVGPAFTGGLTIGTTQDWTSIRTVLDQAAERNTIVVLYRSGFVEQDTNPENRLSPVDLAPLHPPRAHPLTARVIPLTYTWSPGSEKRLAEFASAARENGGIAYFVSPGRYSPDGSYGHRVLQTLNALLPEATATLLECCTGIEAIRFEIPMPERESPEPVSD